MKRNFILSVLALFFVLGFSGCDTDENNYTIPNLTPAADDYNISDNLFQTTGNISEVTITAKTNKSPGAVTVFYTGIQSTTYEKNTAIPAKAGVYNVTFDVAAAEGWNAATGLSAGVLSISSGGSAAELEAIPVSDVINLLASSSGYPPTVIASQVTTLNSLINFFQAGLSYEMLSYSSDIKFYKDEDGEVEFKGTDPITQDTILYSTISFDLIVKTVTGGQRYSFTINDFLEEFDLNDTILEEGMTLNDLFLLISDGDITYTSLNNASIGFFAAASGGSSSNRTITGGTMTIWSNWPLEDIVSMF
jgi:hypothetical protein